MSRLVRCAVLLATASIAGACRIGAGPAVQPLRGDKPKTIAIWPLTGGADPSMSTTWFAGLADACRRRGYRIINERVALEILREDGVPPEQLDLNTVGRTLLADAVLQLRVHEFNFHIERGTMQEARWNLQWRLLSTRNGAEQWSHAHHGSWRLADGASRDPLRPLQDDQDARDIVPIGGHRPAIFQTPADLLANLHNQAAMHLPAY